MQLIKICEDNFQKSIHLKVTVPKEEFVDTVVYSLAEAWLHGKDIIPFGIYLEEEMIGFASLYIGECHYQIINFLIDDQFQNRGYGHQAAMLCINYFKDTFNAKMVSLPVHIQHIEAIEFWRKLGFYPSDNIEDDYLYMRKDL